MSVIDNITIAPQSILNHDTTSEFGKLWTMFGTQLDIVNAEILKSKMLLVISSATGLNLDGIGQLINEDRVPGATDEEYRIALYTKIAYIRTSGSGNAIIDGLTILTQASGVTLIEEFPATVRAWVNVASGTVPTDINTRDRDIVAAGVDFYMHYTDGFTPFVFDGDPDGLGFSDLTGVDGGRFSKIY